jgi:autotransporter-associated beta strand protein
MPKADFVSADANFANGTNDLVVTTVLSWNASGQEGNSPHGTFTLTGANSSFDLGANLADRTDVPAAGIFPTGWDGKTLTKAGDGTLTLSGANTYTGGTDVNAGTLNLTGSVTSDVTVSNGSTFELSGLSGADVAFLNGTNTFVGHQGGRVGGNFNANDTYLDFLIPASITNGTTLITVAGNAAVNGATVSLGMVSGLPTNLTVGSTLNLLTSNLLTGNAVQGSMNVGDAVLGNLYTFDLRQVDLDGDGNLDTLQAYLASRQDENVPPPNQNEYSDEDLAKKSYLEGWLAGVGLLNAGQDMISDVVSREAVDVAWRGDGIITYGEVRGGRNNFDTGSNIELNYVNAMVGAGYGKTFDAGSQLTGGLFFEYAYGSYDTHNDLNSGAKVDGSGDLSYYGGGAFVRADYLGSSDRGHFYAEMSWRAGQLTNDFTRHAFGQTGEANYRDDGVAMYLGGHFTFGYQFNLNDHSNLDIYGKGLWSHLDSEDVTLTNGDTVSYQSIDSQRLRVGARYTYAISQLLTPYAGLAYEFAFSGDLDASINGESIQAYGIDKPAIHGNNGIAEVGLTLTPSKSLPLFVGVGIQGYAGKRDGFSGSVKVKYTF